MRNRAVVSLLAAGVGLLAADMVVHVSSPAMGQTASQPHLPRSVIGVTYGRLGIGNGGVDAVMRMWSDGEVEAFDSNRIAPAWAGWLPLAHP